MNKKLSDLLKILTQEQLIEIINSAYNSDKQTHSVIEQAIAVYDPKELYKLTNKLLTSVKNGKRFIDYYEAPAFAEKLDRINKGIEKLLPQDPKLALKLCQRFIEIDNRICERVDDSDGFLLACYSDTYHLLDSAFIAVNSDIRLVGNYLYEIYSRDDYGLRGYILDCCKQSLRAGADEVIKALVTNEKTLEDYQVYAALKTIAGTQGDVDGYIRLIKTHYQDADRGIPDQDICDIAKRLNDAFRADEAITWLNKVDDRSPYYSNKTDLLMEAYKLEGYDKKVQQLLWGRFENLLTVEDYRQYLRHYSEEERITTQIKAVELAKSYYNFGSALEFLAAIDQWDEIESLIIEQTEANALDGADYSVYRKLSTALLKQAKYLPAMLLRRALVTRVLNGGKSQYYKYALSDLKKAYAFARQVSDWQGFDNHQTFFDQLRQKHFRKHSFWSEIEAGEHVK